MVHNTHTPRVKYAVYAHFVGVFDDSIAGVDAVLDKLRAGDDGMWVMMMTTMTTTMGGVRTRGWVVSARTHARTHTLAFVARTRTHVRK